MLTILAEDWFMSLIPSEATTPVVVASETVETIDAVGTVGKRTGMSLEVKIPPFEGSNRRRGESVNDYVDSVEIATMDKREVFGDMFDKYRILVFRTNLVSNSPAEEWYRSLKDEDKVSWEALKTKFVAEFSPKKKSDWELLSCIELVTQFKQEKGESMESYLTCALELKLKVPNDYLSTLTARLVSGLENSLYVQILSLHFKGRPSMTFDSVIEALQSFAYPFGDAERRTAEALRAKSRQSTPPDINIVLANMLEKLDKTLASLGTTAAAIGPPPPSQYQQAPQQQSSYPPRNPYESYWNGPYRRPSPTCFRCGETGHMEPKCGNKPLSLDEQAAIRRKVMDQVERRKEMVRNRYAALAALVDREEGDGATSNCVKVLSDDEDLEDLEEALVGEKRSKSGEGNLSDDEEMGDTPMSRNTRP